MAQVNTRSCDECGRLMQAEERWYAVGISDGMVIIVPMPERDKVFQALSLFGVHDPELVLDLCSMDCTMRKVAKK